MNKYSAFADELMKIASKSRWKEMIQSGQIEGERADDLKRRMGFDSEKFSRGVEQGTEALAARHDIQRNRYGLKDLVSRSNKRSAWQSLIFPHTDYRPNITYTETSAPWMLGVKRTNARIESVERPVTHTHRNNLLHKAFFRARGMSGKGVQRIGPLVDRHEVEEGLAQRATEGKPLSLHNDRIYFSHESPKPATEEMRLARMGMSSKDYATYQNNPYRRGEFDILQEAGGKIPKGPKIRKILAALWRKKWPTGKVPPSWIHV